MFFKKIFGDKEEEVEEILKRGRELKVFFKKNNLKEIPLKEKSLAKFLEENDLNLKFFGEILKGIERTNQILKEKVLFPERVIIFSEKEKEEKTGAEIDFEKNNWKFLINLEDPRFAKLKESKLEAIEAIYLLSLCLQLIFRDIPEIQKMVEKRQIFSELEKYFEKELERIKKERNASKFLEELKRVVFQNALEIASFIEMRPYLEKYPVINDLLTKATRNTRNYLQKSASFLEIPFLLADLALCFLEAEIMGKRKIQKKIKNTIARLSKELRNIFQEFKKIYSEVKEKQYEKKIKSIQEEILVPEILEEDKKEILEKVAQRLKVQLRKEIEENFKDKEKKILRELLEKGAKKEDFQEALKIIEEGKNPLIFYFLK